MREIQQQQKKQQDQDFYNSTLRQFIDKLAEKEKMDIKQVEKIIIDSFRLSYLREKKIEVDLKFEIDNKLIVHRVYKIVSIVNDPLKEVSAHDPLFSSGKTADGFLLVPLDISKFSISFNEEIGRRIHKEIQENRKRNQLQTFKEQKEQLIQGKIQSIVYDYCLVELEKETLGYWLKNEWQNIIRPYIGQTFEFLIEDIKPQSDGDCDVILTRNSNKYLYKVAELEIPEIKAKLINIKQIIRIPGVISKIIVQSVMSSVDPVGTCIGPEAVRVRGISSHTYPTERVEIAAWSEDEKQLFFNILAPVKIISIIEKGKDSWEVIVPGSQFYILKKRNSFIDSVANYFQKKINITAFEELENKSHIVFWNGNLDFKEYKNLTNDIEKRQHRQ